MSSQWLLLADFHLATKWLPKQKLTIQWIEQVVNEKTPSHIVFLGDSFHSRTQVCIETQQTFHRLLQFLQTRSWKPQIHLLVGNHDMANRHDREVNSPSLFEDLDKQTFVYDQIVSKDLDGQSVMFVPYHEDQSIIKQRLSEVENPLNTIVFAHIAVDGTRINGISDNSNNICKGSNLSLNLLSRFKKVFAGHFHHHAVYNNFMYVGSPMMYSFADVDQPERGCVLYKSIDNSWNLLTNPHAVQFLALSYNDALNWSNCSLNGKQVKVKLTAEQDESDIAKLDEKFMRLGASNVHIEKPKDATKKPEETLTDARHDIKSVVQEFVAVQQFSPEKKQALVDLCLKWCNDIGARVDNSRFVGKISKVVTHNFLGSPGTKEFNYSSLVPGLYYLQGDNGSGKSTLHDAISFCLFGQLSRNVSVGQVIYKKASDHSVWVSVSFENGYVVTRKRVNNKPSLEITNPDGTTIEKGVNRSTDECLQNILNIDWKTFERITMLQGSTITNFFTSSDKDKHVIIEKLFGLDIQALHEHSREELEKTDKLLQQSRNCCERSQSTQSQLTTKISETSIGLENLQATIRDLTAEMQNIESVLSEKGNLLHQEEDKMTINNKNLSAVRLNIDKCNEELLKASNEWSMVHEDLSIKQQQNKHTTKLLSQLDNKLKQHQLNLEKTAADLEKHERSLLGLQDRNNCLEKDLEEHQKQLKKKQATRKRLKKELENLQTKLEQTASTETSLVQNEAKLQLDIQKVEHMNKTTRAKRLQLKKQINNISLEIHSLTNEIDTLKQKLDTVTNDMECMEKPAKPIDALKQWKANLQQEVMNISNEKVMKQQQYDEKIKCCDDKLDLLLLREQALSSQKMHLEKTIREDLGHLEQQKKLYEILEIYTAQSQNLDNGIHNLIDVKANAHDIAIQSKKSVIIERMSKEVEEPLEKYTTSLSRATQELDESLIPGLHQQIDQELCKESVESLLTQYSDCTHDSQKRLLNIETELEDTTLQVKLLVQSKTEHYNALQKDLHELEERFVEAMRSQKEIDDNISAAYLYMKTLDTFQSLKEQMSSLESKHLKLTEAEQQEKLLLEQETLIPLSDLDVSRKELLDCKSHLEQTKAEKTQIRKQISTHRSKLQTIDSSISSIQEKINKIQSANVAIGKDISKTVLHIENARNRVLDIKVNLEEDTKGRTALDLPNPELTLLEEKEISYRSAKECLVQNLTNLLNQRDALELSLQQLEKSRADLTRIIQEVQFSHDKSATLLDVCQKECDAMLRELQTLQNEHRTHTESANKEVSTLNLLNEKVDLLQFWKDATSQSKGKDKGAFRQFCLQRSVNLINANLSNTLETLNEGHTSNLKCRINDKLIIEEIGNSVSFEQRSSGEQKITLLAVIFTIMDLIIRNCGFETNILFLDEILDALDQNAIYMVEKWISNFTTKKKDLLTFLITHTEIAAAGKSEGIIRTKKDRTKGCQYKAISHRSGDIPFSKCL